MTATTFRLTSGTLEVIGYDRGDRSWVRRELWRGDDGTVAGEYCHAAGPDDATPPHKKGERYDARCGWCWLNAPHTEAAHEQNKARSGR